MTWYTSGTDVIVADQCHPDQFTNKKIKVNTMSIEKPPPTPRKPVPHARGEREGLGPGSPGAPWNQSDGDLVGSVLGAVLRVWVPGGRGDRQL